MPAQRGDIEKPCPPALFDVGLAAEIVIRVGMGVAGNPKLDPAGILCFHCSSRYLELKPVLANLARDAGLVCFGREDLNVSPQERKEGKDPSQWVLMARPGTDLEKLTKYTLWERLPGQEGRRVWTDDYSNILEVFRWELPEPKD